MKFKGSSTTGPQIKFDSLDDDKDSLDEDKDEDEGPHKQLDEV